MGSNLGYIQGYPRMLQGWNFLQDFLRWTQESVKGCGRVILGLTKTARFGGSFVIEVWILIYVNDKMVLVDLNVTGDDIEWGSNHV